MSSVMLAAGRVLQGFYIGIHSSPTLKPLLYNLRNDGQCDVTVSYQ